MRFWYFRLMCKVIIYLRNEFNLWNVHWIMNTSGLLQSKWSPKGFTLTLQETQKGFKLTLQETRSIHDSFNRSKIEFIDFELKKVLPPPPPPPPLGHFADISYLEENFKPHLLRDVCTLCSGALVSDSLLHMLL